MSHPNPQHDKGNEYPEDKVTHYPKKKKLGLPNTMAKLTKGAGKLQQMIHHHEGKGSKDKAVRRKMEKMAKKIKK